MGGRWATSEMSDKENEPDIDTRTLQKRAAAQTSRSAKRERMGEEAYLEGRTAGAPQAKS